MSMKKITENTANFAYKFKIMDINIQKKGIDPKEFIEKEENKEKERIKLYNEASIDNKENLKNQLINERMNSMERINQKIEENIKKIKEYENELKERYKIS